MCSYCGSESLNEAVESIFCIQLSQTLERWTVKISSTRNKSCLLLSRHWELLAFALCRSSSSCFSCHVQPTCPEPNDSEESEDEGMDEGANIDVPAEVVLRVIANGSNSGSTATLEDMLRVEYDRDADANLMVDIDNVDLSLKQCFKLLNEWRYLDFPALALESRDERFTIEFPPCGQRRAVPTPAVAGRERDHDLTYTVFWRVTKPIYWYWHHRRLSKYVY